MKTRRILFTISLLLAPLFALAGPLPAQTPGRLLFRPLPREYVPLSFKMFPGSRPAKSIKAFDVDGDGDPDLLAEGIHTAFLLLNDGRGVFTEAPASRLPKGISGDDKTPPAVGDVDRDGDLDFLMSDTKGIIHIYLNDGKGAFTDGTPHGLPWNIIGARWILLFDADGDGDLDLATANLTLGNQKPGYLFFNDGKGVFTRAPASNLPLIIGWTIQVLSGDMDGDGDEDLLFCDKLMGATLLLNDGKGRFTNATAARIPFRPPGKNPTGIQIGDIDGDGDLDILESSLGDQGRVLVNDGKGFFSDQTGKRMPSFRSFTRFSLLSDLDMDGDLDLLLTGDQSGTRGSFRLLTNNGKGVFKDATPPVFNNRFLPPYSFDLADLDGDGDKDLVLPWGGAMLFFNDGNGGFHEADPSRLPPRDPRSWHPLLVEGDMDGDGDPDLVAVETGYPSNQRFLLYKGTGYGRFLPFPSAKLPSPAPGVHPFPLLSLDCDGDGDLDILLEDGGSGRTLLWKNDGKANFRDCTSSCMPPSDGAQQYLASARDLDGDGDKDILLVSGYSSNPRGSKELLYLNDGKGKFTDGTAGRLPATGGNTNDVAIGDVDGDGDPDLVFGLGGFFASKGGIRLYLNDGKGKFTDVTGARLGSTWGDRWAYCIDLGDIDGDGDLDIFVQAGTLSASALFLNDGKGFFTNLKASRFPANTKAYFGGFMDVDGDGDPDLVGTAVLVNDGKGYFKELPGALPPELGRSYALGGMGRGNARIDLDGDGDEDFLGLQGDHSRPFLVFNLRRHLHAPFLPAMGRPYELRFSGDPGKAVLPLLSLNGARVDLVPLGIFRLGAKGTAALPPVWFAPSGTARVFLAVPKVPALLNATFYVQGLVLDPASPYRARLTNALKETVLGI